MSNNRFVFGGIAELRAALRALPRELKGEGGHIVEARANSAAATIRADYAVHDGDLRDGVSVRESEGGPFGAGAVVVSAAKHAHLYEFGTQVRTVHKTGQNAGAMPPKPTFVPAMVRERRRMYGELADMLERHGLTVTGDAG